MCLKSGHYEHDRFAADYFELRVDTWLPWCSDEMHCLFTVLTFAVPVLGLLANVQQTCSRQQEVQHHIDTISVSFMIEAASPTVIVASRVFNGFASGLSF